MNMKGTGIAIVATAPKIDAAGPTPKLWNMGLAARGSPAAKTLLRNVFAETALAAYRPYVSTRKLQCQVSMKIREIIWAKEENAWTIFIGRILERSLIVSRQRNQRKLIHT